MATSFRRTASTPDGDFAASNANLIPQKWSKDDYKYAFAANAMAPFIGKSDTAIIQTDSDFLKSKGDKLTFGLRGIDSSDGQGDDGTYEGNEGSMSFYDMSAEIHERGNSWLLDGNMTEQAAYTSLRDKNRTTAREWVGRIQAGDIVAALSGLPTMKLKGRVTGERAKDSSGEYIETVNQVSISDKSDSALRHFCGGQSAAGDLTRVSGDANVSSSSTCLFGTQVIEYAKRMAQKDIDASGNFISPLRPVMVNGEPYYVLFISRLQEKALRGETAWLKAARNAAERGRDNPLFKSVDYVWNNVLVKVTDLLHSRIGAGGTTASEYFDTTSDACASGITVHRALFCGAQAGVMAWGKKPVWKDGFKDWQKTKFGTHTDMIYGIKKTVFATGSSSSNVEFGCITIDTAVAND